MFYDENDVTAQPNVDIEKNPLEETIEATPIRS